LTPAAGVRPYSPEEHAMTETTDAVPTAIRRLDSDDAARLARLVGAYDDLQTVLQCCERLLKMLGATAGSPGAPPAAGIDEIGVEALWTLTLLCYGRGFGVDAEGGEAVLTEDDLVAGEGDKAGDVVRWHRVLMHLRDHHADPLVNPRESYTVGVAQDGEGVVNAVAVTSVHSPEVDQNAVRQAGTMALPLCTVLDGRIGELQKVILAQVRDTPRSELETMDLIEVVAAG
jgi:hypothetical protein